MPATLPYLPSYKNVELLSRKIADAKVPEAFTHSFLHQTLGLKSTTDRPLIPLLRTLGFIDASGKPTPAYTALKNPARARQALGQATRSAYAPLFEANENAHELNQDDLRGLVAQVAGSDADMTTKILGTFRAPVHGADFNAPVPALVEAEPEKALEVNRIKQSIIEQPLGNGRSMLQTESLLTFRSTYHRTLPRIRT